MIITPQTHCGYLFDADGNELTLVTWADIETGQAVHLKLDESGKLLMSVDDSGELVAAEEMVDHPAPLRFEPSLGPFRSAPATNEEQSGHDVG